MSVKQLKLTYALKDGEIVSIEDVKSGLSCGCICPACGDPLVAKKGEKMMHHFAHHAGHTCEFGYESSLYLAAKNILSKAKKIVIVFCMTQENRQSSRGIVLIVAAI